MTPWSEIGLVERSRDVTMMLKEVQVPPGHFFEVIRFAQLATTRIWELCAQSACTVKRNSWGCLSMSRVNSIEYKLVILWRQI